MLFKGFQMERATAELTYYDLLDGTVYDSHITKFGNVRMDHRAKWTEFYQHIKESIAGKSAPEAESIIKSEIAAELARKPRTDIALAAESLQARLDQQGVGKTMDLLRQF